MNKIIYDLKKENKNIVNNKPGFPYIGQREDGKKFGDAVRKIENAWYFYDEKLYEFETKEKIIKLNSGNPIDYKPFDYSLKYLKKRLKKKLYQYPSVTGEESEKEKIVKYLVNLGYPENLKPNNIIITCSTTQGFYLILKSIFKIHDVIIMTAPNYGLFAFMPERLNIDVETIELNASDDYLINPKKLNDKIKEINKNLMNKYSNLEYIPRVKAFLNINPHNPLGTVISRENMDLLEMLGKVCKENNIFVIDDLVYRDLTYDQTNLAKPLGTIEEYFDNSISLYGLSKSFGMANTRSGFVVANEFVINLLRNHLFYIMDSTPYLQTCLLSGTYNVDRRRDLCYKKYFKKLIKKYIFNCYLTIALIEGIEAIKDNNIKNKIKKYINKYVPKYIELNHIYFGIPKANVKLIPKAGFFLIVDFTELSRCTEIKSEEQLLEYLYRRCGVKFLFGKSFSWPNENEIIIRVTYSLSVEEIIEAYVKINQAIRILIQEYKY